MSRLLAAQRALTVPGWVKNELWRRARATPSLDLRFAESKSLVDATTGQNLVTFTRASGGTYVDSQGVIRNAVTNLLVRSEELNDAGWEKVNSAISENTASAPNGTTTADKLVANTANATHRVRIPSASYIAGSIYTFSVYAKAGEYSQLTVTTGTVFTGEPEADYTLSGAGTSNDYGTNVASINAVGDGWYRLTITATAASTTTSADAIRILLVNGGNAIFAGDNTSGLFLWGAQLEQSSTVGEYIPTGATINSAPRFDHNPTTGESLGLLVEEARTNSIRNNTMVGAVAGTPGTLPTNWVQASLGSGLTSQVIGTGSQNGISYIDVRISGTAGDTVGSSINFDGGTQVAASSGQSWTGSLYLAIIGGSTSGMSSTNIRVIERTGAGGYVTESNSSWSAAGSSLTSGSRLSVPRSSMGATTGFVQFGMYFNTINGVAIDITLRIGMPQLEQGAFATSVIPTTGTAATRSADVASISGSNFSSWYRQGEGSLFVDGSAQKTDGVSGGFLELNDTTASNQVDIRQYRQDPFVCGGGSANVAWSSDVQGTISPNVIYRQAVGYSPSSHGSAISGVVRTSSSAIGPIAATRLVMFMRDAQTSPSGGTGGHIRRLTYWPQRLGNEVLQRLTQ